MPVPPIHTSNKGKEKETETDKEKEKEKEKEIDKLFASMFHFTGVPELGPTERELNSYREEPAIKLGEDPLLWWRKHRHQYPHVAILACRYLAIPATSAASERVFSSGGNIVTKKRSALALKNAAELIFAHQNKDYLEWVVSVA